MSADTINTDFKFEQDDNNGDIHMSAILFFYLMWAKTGMLYLFNIANSHGRVGEQAGAYHPFSNTWNVILEIWLE